jgi:nucleoside 2-deoxyribosyltransferase
MSFHVYLAGPISGLTFGEATTWREEADMFLSQRGITALSPLRKKDFLKQVGLIGATDDQYAHLSVLGTSRGIMTRDRWDCIRANVVLINLLGAKTVSIGTVMEIAWANQAGNPVVCVMERDGNVHEHCMVQEAIDYRVETLDAALDVVVALRGPRI